MSTEETEIVPPAEPTLPSSRPEPPAVVEEPKEGNVMPGLAGALARAQSNVKMLTKDGANTDNRTNTVKYRYTTSEQVIEEARRVLSAEGVAVLTITWRYEPLKNEVDEFSGMTLIGRIHAMHRVWHSSGQYIDCPSSTPVLISKGRPDDKAEAAALTLNLAYFLRGLLLIPRGDDAAIDQRDDSGWNPPQRRQQKNANTRYYDNQRNG
jgi:hypothetical protein